MKLLLENFRRFITENDNSMTIDDVETLAKLFRILRGVDGAGEAFALADAIGMTDEVLEVLYFGVGGRKERVIDVLEDLEEDEAEEIAKILDISVSRRRIMRNFMETPGSVEMASKRTDDGEPVLLVTKILDISDEKFNTSGFLGGWDGLFEATVIIRIITNPNTSDDIMKRIVRLTSKWNSTGKSRRMMLKLITMLSASRNLSNAPNAPKGPLDAVGPDLGRQGGHFSMGSKIITPEWLEWAKQ